MTMKEVAKYLRVHEMTAYRWIRDRRLPAFKIGGRWRVRRVTLESYIEDQYAAK